MRKQIICAFMTLCCVFVLLLPASAAELARNTDGSFSYTFGTITPDDPDVLLIAVRDPDGRMVSNAYADGDGKRVVKNLDPSKIYTYTINAPGYETYSGTISSAQAQGEDIVLIKIESDVTYSVSDDVLTISGSGPILDYATWSHAPWSKEYSGITKIVVNEGITRIGDRAFAKSRCTDISIPETVTSIGEIAFGFTDFLRALSIPESVTSIEAAAFDCCSDLTITFAGSAPALADDVFSRTTGLTVCYPAEDSSWNSVRGNNYGSEETVTWLPPYEDDGDETDPDGDEADPNVLDSGICGAEGDGTNLTWTLTSDGVLTISGTGAMRSWGIYDNSSLRPWEDYLEIIQEVVIEDGASEIGHMAFEGCSNLQMMTIPASVTVIEQRVSKFCHSLKSIYYGGTLEQWKAIDLHSDNARISACNIYTQDGFKAGGSTPSGTCGDGVFWILDLDSGALTISGSGPMADMESRKYWQPYMEDIVSVSIGEGVTRIGEYAFSKAASLERVEMANSVAEIGNYAFSDCWKLKNVQLSQNVRTLGNGAFNETAIEEIILPEGLESIGFSAFAWCESLKSIVIPASVTSLLNYAFQRCYDLKRVEFLGEMTSISPFVFIYCSSLEEVLLPDSVTTIGSHVFHDCALKSITLPRSLTEIKDGVFYGCKNLQDVYYEGTEEEWAAITINEEYNEYLLAAKVHYGGSGEPEVNEYAAVNPRVENGSLFWDTPEALEARGDFTFFIELLSEDGEWVSLGCTEWGSFPLYEGDAGTYTAARIRTQDINSLEYLAEVIMEVSVTVRYEQRQGDISLSWHGPVATEWGYDVYKVALGGLTPNTEVELSLRKAEGNGSVSGNANSDENGVATVDIFASFDAVEERLTSGTFLVTEYQLTGSGAEFTSVITTVGDWAPCAGQEAPEKPETPKASLSGCISGVTANATVTVGGVETAVNADGSFTVDAPSEKFDVVVKVPGALTYTVKNVTAVDGDITLPAITPVKGDTNNDGMINIMDMGIFRQNFGKMGDTITNAYTDTNGDKMVNIIDMSVFRTNFGKTNKDCTIAYGA